MEYSVEKKHAYAFGIPERLEPFEGRVLRTRALGRDGLELFVENDTDEFAFLVPHIDLHIGKGMIVNLFAAGNLHDDFETPRVAGAIEIPGPVNTYFAVDGEVTFLTEAEAAKLEPYDLLRDVGDIPRSGL